MPQDGVNSLTRQSYRKDSVLDKKVMSADGVNIILYDNTIGAQEERTQNRAVVYIRRPNQGQWPLTLLYQDDQRYSEEEGKHKAVSISTRE